MGQLALTIYVAHLVVLWQRPAGGYFLWLELESARDTMKIRQRADEFEVGFQPGELFSASGSLKNFIRLSFAHYEVADIHKGVSRLAKLLKSS